MTTDYTRLSVAGSQRRIELVVPSDEPLGSVLPQLLELLAEPEGTIARPLTLVRSGGEQLDIARSCVQQALEDGAALRLVRLDAAPPPPLVIDVTDAAADGHDSHADRWDDRARGIAAGVAIAIAAGLGGLLLPVADPVVAAWVTAIALVALAGAAAPAGRGGMPGLGAALAVAAAGLSVPFGVAASAIAARTVAPDAAALIGVAAALAGVWVAAGLGVGVARGSRGALTGAAIGLALAVLMFVLLAVGVTVIASAGVTGVVAAFTTGVLPWVALSAAGLTGLDQRVAEGEPVDRAHAHAAIDDAYSALTWSVAATAAAIAASGAALVAAHSLWAGLLALALALVAALRTRAFPLRSQAGALWLSVAIIATTAVLWLAADPDLRWAGLLACAGIAVLVAIGWLVAPKPHQRARLRGLGNVLEMLAVIALLPLLLGAFGVYADLLALFQVDS